MRDYQRQKNNKYILPRALYHQTLWQIRDYYRLQEKAKNILYESPAPPDGMPKGGDIGDEVSTKSIRRELVTDTIRVIEECLKQIPEEYRAGIWNNIQFDAAFPSDAHRSTYGRYKSMYVYTVAHDLFLL